MHEAGSQALLIAEAEAYPLVLRLHRVWERLSLILELVRDKYTSRERYPRMQRGEYRFQRRSRCGDRLSRDRL